MRQAFRKYLEYGIFAHGFGWGVVWRLRARLFRPLFLQRPGCLLLMQHAAQVESAAHLTDHVFPRLPVRQSVLSVLKRLRYFMQRDGAVLNMVLRIFLQVIAQNLQSNSPGAFSVDKAVLHIGAVVFIRRFGSSLNAHVHFHACVVDRVFEQVPMPIFNFQQPA